MSMLKLIRIGLLSCTILLNAKPAAVNAATIPSPLIALQNAVAVAIGPVTLQYKTSLASPLWQTFGAFSGSTNVSFVNLPAVFVRGVCTNPAVSVQLAWPASGDSSVVGYKIYYGTTSGVYTNSLDVGNTTTAVLSNLLGGTRYYFAATAYNRSGTESPYSNETNGAFQAGFTLGVSGFSRIGGATSFTVTSSAANAVAIPLSFSVVTKKITAAISNPITLQFTTNLSLPNWQTLGTFSVSTNISFTNLPAVFIRGTCTNLAASAALAWQPSSDPAVVGYQVYYGTVSHNYTGQLNVGPSTSATVSNLVSGQTYYFSVTAYNASGVQSPFSNEASGAFQAAFSLTMGNP